MSVATRNATTFLDVRMRASIRALFALFALSCAFSSFAQFPNSYFHDNYISGPECGLAVIAAQDPFFSPQEVGEACKRYYRNPSTGGALCTVNRTTAQGPGWACEFKVTADPARNDWIMKDVFDGDGTTREIGIVRYACADGRRYGDDDIGLCGSFVGPPNAGFCPPGGQGGGDRPKPCIPPHPINPLTGNKYLSETDYLALGTHPLVFERFYNSKTGAGSGRIGNKWRHTFDRSVILSGTKATVVRPDGKEYVFTQSGPDWIAPNDVMDRLIQIQSGWTYTTAPNDQMESYDVNGRLISIAVRAGVSHTLAYDTRGRLLSVTDSVTGKGLGFSYDSIFDRITSVTEPSGNALTFTYDAAGNLSTVTYPSDALPNPVRTYVYNEPANTSGADLRSHLTGIIDENNVRFSTYAYAADGRAISSERAGNTSKYTVAYTGSVSTVTDPLNKARDFGFQNLFGVRKYTGVSQPCDGCGVPSAISYDANGYLSSVTNFKNVTSTFSHDARGLETSRTEALGAPEARTISTQWHATFRLPLRMAEPLRLTTNVYDADGAQCGARGALCSRTVQATTDANGSQGFSATLTGTPRTWTYTYNTNGSVLTEDGPRTDAVDLATYTYYANNDADISKRGNLASITNAAGHLTSITAYNAHGQPLTIVDPNGLTTTLTYDARLRLKTRTVGVELTSYDYDNVGQLTKVTLPDGSFLSYSYDAAHRLTGMEDNQGNRIAYTLDATGNRILEQVFGPASALAQTRSRVYSNLNRLFQDLGAQSQTTEYTYDNQGKVLTVKDPLNHITTNQYDALNRLKQVTDPATPAGVTRYAYNGLDALTQVTDPRNLVTAYTVDGLGKLTLQASPDTGNTVNTHDVAGNLLTQTDAKGQQTTYAYDALNRVTLVTFHDGSKQAYAYDLGTNGIGRLSSITETDAANQQTSLIAYAYSPHGRVMSETRTVNGVQYVVGYSYDTNGRLDGLTYPSGRTLTYSFDTLGRVAAISTTGNGQTQQVVSSVAFHPFGGVKGYTLGNGQAYTRSYDQDGRISIYTLGAKSFGIGYDAASRIEFISELGNLPNSNTYGYDNLDRLTSATTPGTPYVYTYDATGNRLTKSAGAGIETLTISPTSNRIATLTPASGPARSFVFDPNGSTTNDGINSYLYDVRGRMVQATSVVGTSNYQLNALGQRIRKSSSLGDTVFHYDSGGRLIAETAPAGAPKRELIYLGDIPVGIIQ